MNGVVIGLAAVFGVPAAVAIGLVDFVGAYVPYLGGFVGGEVAVLMALGDGALGRLPLQTEARIPRGPDARDRPSALSGG